MFLQALHKWHVGWWEMSICPLLTTVPLTAALVIQETLRGQNFSFLRGKIQNLKHFPLFYSSFTTQPSPLLPRVENYCCLYSVTFDSSVV